MKQWISQSTVQLSTLRAFHIYLNWLLRVNSVEPKIAHCLDSETTSLTKMTK